MKIRGDCIWKAEHLLLVFQSKADSVAVSVKNKTMYFIPSNTCLYYLSIAGLSIAGCG